MANHTPVRNENLPIAIVIAMAAIVGIIIFFRLFVATTVETLPSLIIAVCFVVAVIGAILWASSSRG